MITLPIGRALASQLRLQEGDDQSRDSAADTARHERRDDRADIEARGRCRAADSQERIYHLAEDPTAQRASISTDAAASLVSHSVKPDYPMLARQMRVQGSVVLQALIGRDGLIQNLRILSGPPILATAAEEAVRQWHFKPHFVGSEPVETRANITVNFTISTN